MCLGTGVTPRVSLTKPPGLAWDWRPTHCVYRLLIAALRQWKSLQRGTPLFVEISIMDRPWSPISTPFGNGVAAAPPSASTRPTTSVAATFQRLTVFVIPAMPAGSPLVLASACAAGCSPGRDRLAHARDVQLGRGAGDRPQRRGHHRSHHGGAGPGGAGRVGAQPRARPARTSGGAAQASPTSRSTLPTAPSSTAAWASAACSSGK